MTTSLKTLIEKALSSETAHPVSVQDMHKVQTRVLALQKAALRAESQYLDEASDFLHRHEDDDRLDVLFRCDEPLDVRSLRIQRTLAGISRTLCRSMPRKARRSQKGVLAVDWTSAETTFQAMFKWEDGQAPGESLVAVVERSATLFGEFDEAVMSRVVSVILEDLFNATVSPPEFLMTNGSQMHAQWNWARETLEIARVDKAAAKSELKRLLEEAKPDFGEIRVPSPETNAVTSSNAEVGEVSRSDAVCEAATPSEALAPGSGASSVKA